METSPGFPQEGAAPRNIRLLLEYDGRPFHGWQTQPLSPTIQEVLQKTLEGITGEPRITVRGSGRTDAGVHALGQVANFHTGSRLSPQAFLRALNSLLPPEIAVLSAQEMPVQFDARFSATSKHYRYRLFLRSARSPLNEGRCWHIPYALRESDMAEAAAHLTGTRDFSSFRSAGCASRTAERTLSRLTLRRKGEFIEIDLVADGFLRHMARSIVGTLVDAGRGRFPPSQIPVILRARDRSRAGRTAPPCGLFLVSVSYEGTPPWPDCP